MDRHKDQTRSVHFSRVAFVRSIVGYKDRVAECVTSVKRSVGICEVKGKPEQASHDNDAPFSHTSGMPALPFKLYSTSTTSLRDGSATKTPESDYHACC